MEEYEKPELFHEKQVVYDVIIGQGRVISVGKDVDYPVQVKFPNRAGDYRYTSDGYGLKSDSLPSLYTKEMKIVEKGI